MTDFSRQLPFTPMVSACDALRIMYDPARGTEVRSTPPEKESVGSNKARRSSLSQAHTGTATMAHDQAREAPYDGVTLQQSLNIPQLLVFLVLTALFVRGVYKWLSGGNGEDSTSSTARGANAAAARRRVDERQIEQVRAMLPQYSRREIYWDLMRNGGRVEATLERVLSGRGLDAVSRQRWPTSCLVHRETMISGPLGHQASSRLTNDSPRPPSSPRQPHPVRRHRQLQQPLGHPCLIRHARCILI